jgi:type I restriction enzyme S subunit
MKLPQNWTKCNLTDLCSVRTGKYDANHAIENGKYRFYTCSSSYSLCNTKSFEGECVIVPGNGDIGQVYYYNGEFEAYQRTYVLEKIYILPSYLYYHLFWNWRHINSDKQFGSTIRYVRIGNFENYIVFLPPLAEQHRIVAKIDTLFSELDNGVALLKTIKAQLAVYRQAVLKWAFEGNLANAFMQEKRKLEELCFFITKGTTPQKNEMFSNMGDIPFFKVYNLTFDGSLDFTIEPTYVTKTIHNNFLNRSKVVSGDVLMNIVGPPLGKVSIVPDTIKEANINQAIARFRCSELLDYRYLANFLLYKKTIEKLSKQAKTTAGQTNLTLEICRNIEIPYCPKPEQQAIVSAIESRLSVGDKLEQIIDQTLALSASLRQSILKRAFEGRLVPQDPNDEPAEKLLERIKAEKTAVLAKQKQIRKRDRK